MVRSDPVRFGHKNTNTNTFMLHVPLVPVATYRSPAVPIPRSTNLLIYPGGGVSSKKLKSWASKVSSSQFQSAFMRFGVSPSLFGVTSPSCTIILALVLAILPTAALPPPLLPLAAPSPGGGAGRGASFGLAMPLAVSAAVVALFGVGVGADAEADEGEGEDEDGVTAAPLETCCTHTCHT